MSTKQNLHDEDPVAKLNLQPTKSILKSGRSIDDTRRSQDSTSSNSISRSESKSSKVPRFDEMNIIATYHPVDKDYGHMKIEEPLTPYPETIIDDDMDTTQTTDESNICSIDPGTLVEKLNQPMSSPSSRTSRKSFENNSTEVSEHQHEFENRRKRHYNEFEVVRLHRKEIEAELRALEQEESSNKLQ